MKKIFALLLAVAMMSTYAFAGDVAIGSGASVSNTGKPGEELYVTAADFTPTLGGIGYRFSSEYFTIAAKKFSKGANLVKEVKFNDDDNELLIVMNDNYELTAPNNSPNLVIDKLEIKARKDYKTGTKPNEVTIIDKGTTYKYTGANKELFIGYPDNKNELDGDANFENNELVKFVDTGKETPYATAETNVSDIYLEGRVYKDDKVFVKIDNKVNKDVLKLSEEAEMAFYNIKTNGFPSTTTVQLSVDEDQFIYKIVDNKLVASGLKWSEDDYAWTGKIRSSVSYVVSDIELKSAPATDAPAGDNPDTGANDVVGIAAALALVSLVAAGAVSMKK